MIKAPNKLHNHYEGNSNIGNKKALFHYISLYCEWKGLNRYDYIPETFHIESQRCPQISHLQRAIKQNPNSLWLVKPGENSNRGNGISIAKNFAQVDQKIRKMKKGTLIIQKYIDKLLLFNGRKFDIRTYMIAITIKG